MKNALERGEQLEKAKKSFINAGYEAIEVEAAAKVLMSGEPIVQINQISKEEIKSIEDEKARPKGRFSLNVESKVQKEKKDSWIKGLFSKKKKDEPSIKPKEEGFKKKPESLEKKPEVLEKKPETFQGPQVNKEGKPPVNFVPQKRRLPHPGMISQKNPLPVARYQPPNFSYNKENKSDSTSKWIIIFILILITILIVGAALIGLFWKQLFSTY